ncbi:MAG TPA: HAD-IIA family hydrolase [Candidatus Limnocylindrales bacterium]
MSLGVASRQPMAGIRGFLLDLDGVLVWAGRPIAGAPEALAELARRGLPYRIVTNTSLVSRAALAAECAGMGLPIAPDRIVSAVSATAAWTARELPGAPLFVITSPEARSEFAGQHLLDAVEAERPGARIAAVVIGDSPDLDRANLDVAFRLARGGARLVAMHRNGWWLTGTGPTLDSGAYVVALEYALGRRALVLGKPSPPFFREAGRSLALEIARAGSAPRVALRELAMVGDDIVTDVLAAQRVGLRGVFLLSGRHGRDDLDRAARRRGGGRPDVVFDSIGALVASL